MTESGRFVVLAGSSLLALACARGEPAPGVPPAAPSAPVEMKDSLVLSAPGGVTVWFSEGRPATDSKGATCLERTLEIRRDSNRIKVPLLYTISAPTLANDSTLRAELAKNCHPAEAYHVDLRTGQPTKVP